MIKKRQLLWFEEPAYATSMCNSWQSEPDANGYSCGGCIGDLDYCCMNNNCWSCSSGMSQEECKELNNTDPKIFFSLPDGAVIGLYKKDTLVIHIDINGPKKPNKNGYDKFVMATNASNQVSMTGNGAKLQANNWEFDKKYIDSIED